MTDNSERLIYRLKQKGVHVHAIGRTGIFRDQSQESLNRNAGEFAPTWELQDMVMGHGYRRNSDEFCGSLPAFDFKGERYEDVPICSYQPVSHIVRQPVEEWDVYFDEHRRLIVETKEHPKSWT